MLLSIFIFLFCCTLGILIYINRFWHDNNKKHKRAFKQNKLIAQVLNSIQSEKHIDLSNIDIWPKAGN